MIHPVIDRMKKLAATNQAPWQCSLATYLGPQSKIEIDEVYKSTAEKLAERLPDMAGFIRESWIALFAHDCTIAESTECETFSALPDLMAFHEKECVGLLHGGDIYVSPAFRGRGLGAELLLTRAVLHDNGRKEGCLYSRAGYAAAVKSHHMAVEIGRRLGSQVSALESKGHQQALQSLRNLLDHGRAPIPLALTPVVVPEPSPHSTLRPFPLRPGRKR